MGRFSWLLVVVAVLSFSACGNDPPVVPDPDTGTAEQKDVGPAAGDTGVEDLDGAVEPPDASEEPGEDASTQPGRDASQKADTGDQPLEDAGTQPGEDASQPGQDTGTQPGPDAGTQPGQDASVGYDAGPQPNRPPVLDAIAAQTLAEGDSKQVLLTATDPDGDPLTFTLKNNPTFASVAGNVLSLAPTSTDSGSYTFQVEVSDGEGGTDSATVTVTVTDNDGAPVFDPLLPVVMVEATTQTVTIVATDPGAGTVTLSLAAGAPAWATLAGNVLTLAPGYTDAGSYIIGLVATGPTAKVANASLSVTVNDANRPPVLAAIPVQTVAEGSVVTVTLSATDPDGDTLTYSLAADAPSWMTISGNVITLAPGYDDAGSGSVDVTVSDGKGGTDTKPLAGTVTDTNRAPVLDPIAATSLAEGSVGQVFLVAADPDGDTLTFSLRNAPAWATLSGAVLNLSPPAGSAGTFSIDVDVADGKGGTDTEKLAVTVTANSGAPVFGALTPVTMDEGETRTVSISVTDPESNPITLTLGAGAPGWASLAGTTLTLAPDYSAAGSHNVPLVATDSTGKSSNAALAVTVNDVNRAPVLAGIGAQTLAEGATKTVALSATDPDGDAVVFSLGAGAPSFATLVGTTLTLAPTFANAGNHTLEVIATDAKGATDSETVSVTVTDVNRAPVLDPVAAQTVAEGTTATISLVASDPDGDAVTFALRNNPAWVTLVGSVVTLAPGFADAGAYSFFADVSDGKGGTDSESIAVTVTDVNSPPVFGPLASVSMNEGETRTVALTVTDPEGDTFTVTLGAGAPTWAAVSGTVLTLTPSFGDSGSYSVPLVATDSKGAASDATLAVAVSVFNRPPVLDPIAAQTVAEGASQTVALSATDPDGDPLTYSLAATKPAFVTLAGSQIAINPGYADAGSYTIAVTVDDGHGGTDTKNLVLTVTDVNRAPVIGALTAVTMEEGATRTVTLSATDPDGDAVTLALSGNPTWASLSGNTLSLNPGYGDEGAYSLTITATDSKSASSTATQDVTVTDKNRAPVFGTLTAITMDEGTTQTAIIPVSDPDLDTVTLTLGAGAPTWASLSGTTLTLTPGFTNAGTHSIPLVATDSKGATANAAQAVTVNNVNQPPVFAALTAQTVAEGATRTVTISATDVDGDSLTFTLEAGAPSWAAIAPATATTATLTLTPGYSAAGTYTIPLRVVDGNGGSDTDSLSVTVTDTNRPPVLAGFSPVTVAEGATETVNASATDPDGDTVTYSVVSAPAWVTVTGNVITLSPGYTNSGTYNLTVQAADGNGGTDTKTLAVTVTNVNRAPTLSAIPAQTVAELANKTVTLVGTDPDGDTLIYSLVSPPVWAGVAGAVVTLNPPLGTAGSHTLTARVQDPGGLSDTETFTVTVTATNVGPAVAAAPAPEQRTTGGTLIAAGSHITAPPVLYATLTDPNAGDQVQLEAEVVLTSASFTGTPTHSSTLGPVGARTLALPSLPVGSYKWQVRAKDAGGLTSSWSQFASAGTAFIMDPQAFTGTVSIAGGAAYTQSATVNVGLAITPAPTEMRFSNDGSAWSTWEAYSATKVGWSLTPPAGQGAKTVYVEVRTGTTTAQFQDDIVYDSVAPVGTFTINGGASYTNELALTLNVGAISDVTSGVATYAFSNDNVTFSNRVPVGGNVTWNLFGTDGAKTVYGRFTDNAGNVLNVSATITLDRQVPTATVSINAAAAYTTTAAVTLSIAASDNNSVAQVCYSNDGTNFSGCGAYAATRAWTLAAGDGTKTVTIRVTDVAGNTATASDTIVLDGTRPTVSFTIEDLPTGNNSGYTNDLSVTLRLSGTDATSGVYQMQFSNDNVSWSTLEAYSATKTWALAAGTAGSRTAYVRITDNAGNQSLVASRSVIYDNVAPSAGTVSINAGASYTTSASVTLTLSCADAYPTGACAWMEFSNDGGTSWSPREAYATTKSWTLAAPDGVKTVTVRFADPCGNYRTASDTIHMDTVAPVISLFTINSGNPAAINTTAVSLYFTIDASTSNLASLQARNGTGTWVTISATSPVAWTLPAGDGTKTVELRATDYAGNVRTATDTIVLDTVAPVISSFALNGGSTYTNNLTITGNNTVTETGSGTNQVCFSTVTPPGNCVAYTTAPTNTMALTTTDGVKTFYLRVSDNAGNVSTISSDTITMDRTRPTVSAVSLDSGATYTQDTSVAVGSTAADPTSGGVSSGVSSMAFSNDGTTWSGWYSYANPRAWTIATGDGSHTVWVKVRDNALNESASPYPSDSIILDTVAPTGTIVVGNSTAPGPTYTTSRNVTVYANATDATSTVAYYCLKENTTTPAAGDACWLAYPAGTQPRSLAYSITGAGDGTKTVYAWFRDGSGRVSTMASDAIILDTTAPTVPTGLSVTASHRTLDISWTASTDTGGSGVQDYTVAYALSAGGTKTVQVVTGTSVSLTVPSELTYYVSVRSHDVAGNYSAYTAELARTPRFPWAYESRRAVGQILYGVQHLSATTAVAVGEGGALFRTTDAFATYARIDSMVDDTLRDLTKSGTDAYVAVGNNGVVTGVYGTSGMYWQAGTNNDAAKSTLNGVVGFNTYDVVAVGAGGKIVKGTRTANSGRVTFNAVASPTTSTLNDVALCESCTNTLVAVGAGGAIVRSTNGGTSWSLVTPPAGYTTANFYAVAGVPGTQTMYLSSGVSTNPLLRSTDGGATWASFTAPTNLNGAVYNSIVAYNTTTIYLAANGPRIVKWNGSTTATIQALPGGSGSAAAQSIHTLDGTNVSWVGYYGQIVNTSTGGTTWFDRSGGVINSLHGVATVPNSYSNGFVVGSGGTVLRTTDRGATWLNETSGTFTNSLYSVAAPATNLAFAVGSSGGIRKFTGTWATDADSGITTQTLYGVSCYGTTRCWAVGNDGATLEWSGTNWIVRGVGLGLNLRGVSAYLVSTTQRAVAVGLSGAVRTYNGSSWSTVTVTGSPSLWGVHGTGTAVIAVGTSGGVYRSIDNGATWTKITVPTTADLYGVTSYSTIWYAAGAQGTVLKSTDNGVTWTLLQTNAPGSTLRGISSASTTSTRVWAVGTNGLILDTTVGGN